VEGNGGLRAFFLKKGFSLSSWYFLCVLCGLGLTSCGKKGPPLPPLVYVPAAASEYTAKRLGNDVVLQFKIPAANTDATRPADLERVEVYAHTEPLPSPADYLRYGTLIATIPVRPPPLPDSVDATGAAGEATQGQDAKTELAAPKPSAVEQGWAVSVSEAITEAHKQPGLLPYTRPLPTAPVIEQLETPGTVNLPPPIMRYYVVTGVNRRNRRGMFAGPVGVPLTTPPAGVEGVKPSYTKDALSLSWEAPATPVWGYNVYQVDPDPVAPKPPTPTKVAAPVQPANSVLLAVPAFTDVVQFGATRCYAVRSVVQVRNIAVESDPSAPVCVTPRDTFPPEAPRQLAAVSDDKGVSLIWEQNTEGDLAGYLVLRGDAPGEKLAPLNASPTRETTYRDNTVQPGRTYVYAVVAVDTAVPPNVSEPSNRTTEAIR
jgi:hypothetical protein